MAPKVHKIHTIVPSEMALTPAEMAKLKKVYKAGTAQVLNARKSNEPAPVSDQNIGSRSSGKPRKGKKRPARKSK